MNSHTRRFPNIDSSISTVVPGPPIFLDPSLANISAPITSLQNHKLTNLKNIYEVTEKK